MDFKPYIALDIETTGLMDYDQVLQVAMIYDDLKSPIADLERISFLVDNSEEVYHGPLDPVAISMNAWIFKEIVTSKKGKSNHLIVNTESARNVFHEFLKAHYDPAGKAITFAGKNVAGFDMKVLERTGFINEYNKKSISYRVIDTGSLYLLDFGYVPTQSEINKLIGRQAVTHDALDDAMDVVCAIRTKCRVAV